MAETRYLKLKLSADLTADAKSNLLKIDSLGAATSIEDGDLLLRASENIVLQPQSADIAGNGSGGEIVLGDTDHEGMTVTSWADDFFLNCALSIKNSASGKTNFISLDFNDSSSDASNQTLTIGLGGENRDVEFSTDGEVVVVDPLTGVTQNIKEIGQLDVALSVENGGTGSQGPANDPHVLDNLVPAYTAAERGYALAVDDDDEANGLIWKQFAAGGTVTSVELDVTAIPEFILSATSNPIEVAGTFTLSKTPQLANKFFAGPVIGPAEAPIFRSIAANDLPNNISQSQVTNLVSDLAAKEPTITAPNDATKFFNGQKQFVSPTKSDVGLGNVDNTSDVNKPVSTATQTALNLKYDASNPSSYVDAAGAQTAVVVQTVSSGDTTHSPSADAIKTYVDNSVSAGMSATDWTAGTSIEITHGFGTRDVMVSIYEKDAPYAELYVDKVERTDTTKVTLTASAAPTGNGWRVLVRK